MHKYRILRRTCIKEDSLTYGDWRQYVAFLDDHAVCVRLSALPGFLAMIGFLIVSMLGLAVLMAGASFGVAWGHFFVMCSIGFALLGPFTVERFTDWRLVVAVSPNMLRKEDGTYRRHF